MVSEFKLKMLAKGVDSALSLVNKTVAKLEKAVGQYEQAREELAIELADAQAKQDHVIEQIAQTKKIAENFKNLMK